MRFTVYLSNGGVPATGLADVVYNVWQITGAGVASQIQSGVAMTGEIGGGFYFYDLATSDVDYDYVARAESPTLSGAEKYAPCISTVQGDVQLIRAIEAGRWNVVGNTMTFYDEDNVTEIISFTLTGTSPNFTGRSRV